VLPEFVGESLAMRRIQERIERFAPSPVPILILGETGTGKDRCAHAIWERSGREGPWVAVNCAAIPESLIDSELFGHEQGAFTGALRSRAGLVAQADGGILFLDELGELSLPTQAKLLRSIETGEYRPVGSDRVSHSTFRVIAAARPDLDQLVVRQRFRADLLHRLGSVRIHMPPLRERIDDIPRLARAFMAAYRSRNQGRGPQELSDDAVRLLQGGVWPGNVRQLRNVVEAAAASAGDRLVIEAMDVAEFLPLWTVTDPRPSGDFAPLAERLRWAEEQSILEALDAAEGSRVGAARLLGISEATLYRKLAQLRGQGHFPSLVPDET
jgi:DNA-binding NtrC family response regulator